MSNQPIFNIIEHLSDGINNVIKLIYDANFQTSEVLDKLNFFFSKFLEFISKSNMLPEYSVNSLKVLRQRIYDDELPANLTLENLTSNIVLGWPLSHYPEYKDHVLNLTQRQERDLVVFALFDFYNNLLNPYGTEPNSVASLIYATRFKGTGFTWWYAYKSRERDEDLQSRFDLPQFSLDLRKEQREIVFKKFFEEVRNYYLQLRIPNLNDYGSFIFHIIQPLIWLMQSAHYIEIFKKKGFDFRGSLINIDYFNLGNKKYTLVPNPDAIILPPISIGEAIYPKGSYKIENGLFLVRPPKKLPIPFYDHLLKIKSGNTYGNKIILGGKYWVFHPEEGIVCAEVVNNSLNILPHEKYAQLLSTIYL